MLRWTFPYILFVCLAALAGGVLNSYGKFAVPATTSTLMNVVMIVFAPSLRRTSPARHRAGDRRVRVGLVQLGFQLPFMIKLGLLRRPRWNWVTKRCARSAGSCCRDFRFVGVAGGVAAGHPVASFLATGSIAWLYYADRLVEFPLGVSASRWPR